ncbi:MAG: acyl-CoA dehydrogenase family protein [Anaerolineae bacterium]
MNYAFTDEQAMFRDMFADFAAKEVEPRRSTWPTTKTCPPLC